MMKAVYSYHKVQGTCTSRSYEGLRCWSIRLDPAFLFAPELVDEDRQVLCIPDMNT